MSAAPAFEHYAFAVDFSRQPAAPDATVELFEFATADEGGMAAPRRTLIERYRFSVPAGDYDAMMARIDPLLGGWKGGGKVFCVDGPETEFERLSGTRILSLADPCGAGSPDKRISAEVLRTLRRYGPAERLPVASDWYGSKTAGKPPDRR